MFEALKRRQAVFEKIMNETPLRILFVAGYFPPRAPMGAIRSGKLADYWRTLGHDVRVLAIDLPENQTAERTAPFIYYVPFREPGMAITRAKSAIDRLFAGRSSRSSTQSSQPSRADSEDVGSIKRLGLIDLYRQALQFPDRFRNWVKPAAQTALSWKGTWQPDVIYTSGPPHTVHVAALKLSRRLGVPWIAELRDLWADDPYYDRHFLIKPLLDWTAHRVISAASACVVVTNWSKSRLEATIHRPIVVSYNGYDAAEFEGLDRVEPLDPQHLTIIHAGIIYAGRRDPTPLFKAIAALGDRSNAIRCLFYHDARRSVSALAARYGISHCVEIRDAIPRPQILRVEREADILLECRWVDPAGDGVIPGKLFEYIGARRPILSLGSLTGEAAHIIRDNGLGLVSNDPEEIRAALLAWLESKSKFARLPDLAPSANGTFRRETQFHKIDMLIGEVLRSGASR